MFGRTEIQGGYIWKSAMPAWDEMSRMEPRCGDMREGEGLFNGPIASPAWYLASQVYLSLD
jgi:hypothetical protein